MQIDSAASSTAPATSAPAEKSQEEKTPGPSGAANDPVEVSPTGRTAADLSGIGIGRFVLAQLAEGVGDAGGDRQIALEELQANLVRHMAVAEKDLWRLASDTGIDPRDVAVRVNSAGELAVEGEDPDAGKLEATITRDTGLYNALTGAKSMSNLLHIGSAADMAQNATQSDPARADFFFDWARGIAEQTKGMDMVFLVSGGRLTARYETADGQTFGVSEGLKQSALASGFPASAID